MADKKKKNRGIGVAVCFLAALVIFIIFLVQRKTIAENLKDTNLFERLGIKTPKMIENIEIPQNAQSEDDIALGEETFTVHIDSSNGSDGASATSKSGGNGLNGTGTANSSGISSSNENAGTNSKGTGAGGSNASESSNGTGAISSPSVNSNENKRNSNSGNVGTEGSSTSSTAEVKYMELQLCFVDYGADGIVYRKIVKRSVPKNDSPLSTAIKLLLEGPDSTKNSEKNCLTLIPENTRLLSAKVEDGVAYLDFSEDFEFNSFGVDGYRSQLMQIVYTATAFPTVKSVQFLIEGQKKEYLGSEGQRIGSSLSRNSF